MSRKIIGLKTFLNEDRIDDKNKLAKKIAKHKLVSEVNQNIYVKSSSFSSGIDVSLRASKPLKVIIEAYSKKGTKKLLAKDMESAATKTKKVVEGILKDLKIKNKVVGLDKDDIDGEYQDYEFSVTFYTFNISD